MLLFKRLLLTITMLICPSFIFAATSAPTGEHAHNMTMIGAVIFIVCMLALRIFRMYKMSKRGPRKFSLIYMIFLILLFTALGPFRVYMLHNPPFNFEYSTLVQMLIAWGATYLLVAIATFVYSKNMTIVKQERHYLIPNQVYMLILILLTLYIFTVYGVTFLAPELLREPNYLLGTMIVKGLLAGYYLGIGLGMLKYATPENAVVNPHKDEATSETKSDVANDY